VEFDHADLYRDFEGVLTAFRAGAAQVPRSGAVVVNEWSGGAIAAARDATAPLVRVGEAAASEMRLLSWQSEGERSIARLVWQGQNLTLDLRHAGFHNLQNAAMAVAAAISVGTDPEAAVVAMSTFPGVARRMEVVGEASGITVVDDFAHHPTALDVTISAARQRWPERRLVIAFEPRSLTAARRSFQDAYLESLAGADLVMVAPPYHRHRLDPSEVMDRTVLAEALESRGVATVMPDEEDDPVERLLEVIKHGDVVIGCSSGAFGALHWKLIEALTRGERT
jgi:UDP-N-acetylmuramate: L-alanyl-gamma-D-glutamyl-meso-diaminopimelate ligase